MSWWNEFFEFEQQKAYFKTLESSLIKFRKQTNIFPEIRDVFNAFRYCDLETIEVIIFGQDPYHTPGVADGLAFSSKSTKTPPSLKNIFLEIKNEYPEAKFETNSLISWAKQGVLLLNSVLTVNQNEANSHRGIGWEIFIENFIIFISGKKSNIVFIFWGSQSYQLKAFIQNIDNHFILTSPHPSPFSCHRGFFGNNHFKKTNEYLISLHKKPIDWSTK